MRKAIKIIAAVIVGIAVLTALALGYRAVRVGQRAAEMALRGPNAVQEALFVQVGGIGQWVSIRGQDSANPVLLIVHGGPGGSNLFNQYLLRGWEKDFTLVEWDQRGAGKTFSHADADATGDLSIDRIAGDGVQVADWVRYRLHKPKIVLLGHSWGTIIASEMARRRPDLFSAYVATGQIVNMQRGEALGYRLLTERVKGARDAKGMAKLQKIGPPPYRDRDALMAERGILVAHPPASERGRGADDIQTPAALAIEYFGKVEAPHKELALLPGGGHFAIVSLHDQFLAELRARVLPLAIAADRGT